MENLIYYYANLSVSAIIEEAELSPKPGLVDRYDQGAHKDMDINLMIKSANALLSGFYSYLETGLNHIGTLADLFSAVRKIGLEAEKNMFNATNGINTHKGANFSFGLILSALGYYLQNTGLKSNLTTNDINNIFKIVKQMAENLVETDFKNIRDKTNLTNGEKLYLQYNHGGIRKEAEEGYKIITETALPELMRLNHKNIDKSRKYLHILFLIMSNCDDTNILTRGGLNALRYVKETGKYLFENNIVFKDHYINIIEEINKDFIKRNLSSGGSADLLSIVIFLDKVMHI